MGTGKLRYLIAALVSISLYRSDRKNLAIFVGLWAPTLLNLAGPSSTTSSRPRRTV